MSQTPSRTPHVAIACGGTGGHLFPGIAVGNEVLARGGRVTLFISEKEVDRLAVKNVRDMEIVALPSVGLTRGRVFAFLGGLIRSRRMAIRCFEKNPPQVVLAMGGFTSAGPVLAARKFGAACFLHDSNVIPGRANRWLARFADEVFVGFDQAGSRFRIPGLVTGTPVRPEFFSATAAGSREALGLRADDPVLLVMGGSQGASGINRLMQEAIPTLAERYPLLQFIHLTGVTDLPAVQATYHRLGVKALVQVFSSEMHHVLAAATLAVSRAGGSSLAEISATRTPTLLIPFPEAADQHQRFNANAFAENGAAIVIEQNATSGAAFTALLTGLLDQPQKLAAMRDELSRRQVANAAGRIVDAMSARFSLGQTRPVSGREPVVQDEDAGASPLKSLRSVAS